MAQLAVGLGEKIDSFQIAGEFRFIWLGRNEKEIVIGSNPDAVDFTLPQQRAAVEGQRRPDVAKRELIGKEAFRAVGKSAVA